MNSVDSRGMADSCLPQTEFFLSNCSLLIQRNLIGICILTLCSPPLLNSLICSKRVLCCFCSFFGICNKDNHAAYKKWQFYFFLSNVNVFCSFSLLITLAETSIMMLIQSGLSVQPWCCYLSHLLTSPTPCQCLAGHEGRAISLYDFLLYCQCQ